MNKNWRIEQIANVPPKKSTYSKGWKSIRWHMGIEAFGVNGVTKSKGEWLTPIHDELKDNQDELFIVLEGEAEFSLDDKKVKAPAGTLISVKPAVKRGAKSLITPTTLLIVGSSIGAVYQPPDWA
jgi:uncharacterized cupin superfamily protein